MKTKLLGTIAAAFLMLMCFTNAKAQTSVTLYSAGDSTWGNNCPVPVTIGFGMYGTTTGYLPNDSVTMHIFWGDGNDTIFKTPINGSWFYPYVNHVYTSDGIYSLQYIATGPDGMADTITHYNELAIASVCGNVNGKVYLDMNSDCAFTSADSVVRGVPVEIMFGSSIVGYSYTDINGDYSFSVPPGNYTVVVNNLNLFGYVHSCPTSGSIAVNTSSNPTNNFGLTCPTGFDLQGHVSGWFFKPGYPGYVFPSAWNASCLPVSGTVTLTLDPLVTFDSSYITPSNISGNVITWNFNNINNMNYWYFWNSFWNTVYITTSVNAQIGDTVCFTVSVTPTVGDMNPADNTETFCIDVRNSWDPNMKTVSPQGLGVTGRIAPSTELTYNLHFQNTGTDTAYNISLIDTIDSDLDMTTFQAISSTHTMTTQILSGNVVKFIFNNIMLPDSGTNMHGSEGSVSYRIHTKPNLQHGTQIKNTGYIYFDFNAAVVTNTTLNTVDIALGVKEMKNENLFELFPNPANTSVTINFSEAFNGELSLVDVLGKVVIKQNVNEKNATMNIEGVTPGVYNVVFHGENVTSSKKVVVIH